MHRKWTVDRQEMKRRWTGDGKEVKKGWTTGLQNREKIGT